MHKVLIGAVTLLAVLTFVAPAFAASPAVAPMCEATGSYCVGVPNFKLKAPVNEVKVASARNVVFKKNGKMYKHLPTGTLKLTGATNRCVGTYDAISVVVLKCNADGTVWARQPAEHGTYRFINIFASPPGDLTQYLAGTGCGISGCQFLVEPIAKGDYFRFTM